MAYRYLDLSFLLITALIGTLGQCDTPNTVVQEVKKLKDICANRYVPLKSVKEVRLMIRILARRPEYCPKEFIQAFMELEPVLALEKEHRLCDKDKFDQIAGYHFRFINPKLEAYEYGQDLRKLGKEIKKRTLKADLFDYGYQTDQYDNNLMIPVSLQYFFKAWALQVNGLCKRALMENLGRAVQDNLDADDKHFIEKFLQVARTDIKDPISGNKIESLKFNGIIYMPELEGNIRPELDALRDQSLKLDLTLDPELDRFFHACKLKFKPIYSKLIIPIVRLAKLGYDYMGTKLEDGYGKISKDPNVKAWSAITAICESRGDFQMESEPPVDMKPVKYSPIINFNLDGELWINGRDQLEKEFARIAGSRNKGAGRLLYLAGIQKNKIVSFLDPHKSAWFRRNRIALGMTVGGLGFLTGFTNLCLTLSRLF